jgi:hypothetical protein
VTAGPRRYLSQMQWRSGPPRLRWFGPAFVSALMSGATWSATTPARAQPIACREVRGPGANAAQPNFGPCMSPDPKAFFPAANGAPAVIVSNFGLLYPEVAGTKWQYVCDDVFARPAPERIRRSPNGEIFIPTTGGLLITRDGCSYERAGGDISGKVVFDVGIDAKNPLLVFALGNVPRTLWRSVDGGRTFTTVQNFPEGMLLFRLVLPPTRDRQVYLVGRGRGTSTPVQVSLDDGATFTLRDPGTAAGDALTTSLEFLAADPVSPTTLYFNVIGPQGDALWRTTDGAATVAPVLALQFLEGIGGLAFGPTPGTLYVGGGNLFPDTATAPGHLYLSRDNGATWLPPRASPEIGPQFSCLASDGTALYACSVSQATPGEVMMAVSRDEGTTWEPLTRLADLSGPKACVAAQCLEVSQWLCDTYSNCAPGFEPTPNLPVDAGSDAAEAGAGDARGPLLPDEDEGCGCRIGAAQRHAGPAAAAPGLWLVGLLLATLRRRKPDQSLLRL